MIVALRGASFGKGVLPILAGVVCWWPEVLVSRWQVLARCQQGNTSMWTGGRCCGTWLHTIT